MLRLDRPQKRKAVSTLQSSEQLRKFKVEESCRYSPFICLTMSHHPRVTTWQIISHLACQESVNVPLMLGFFTYPPLSFHLCSTWLDPYSSSPVTSFSGVYYSPHTSAYFILHSAQCFTAHPPISSTLLPDSRCHFRFRHLAHLCHKKAMMSHRFCLRNILFQ